MLKGAVISYVQYISIGMHCKNLRKQWKKQDNQSPSRGSNYASLEYKIRVLTTIQHLQNDSLFRNVIKNKTSLQ
jgi:hypothetical protein